MTQRPDRGSDALPRSASSEQTRRERRTKSHSQTDTESASQDASNEDEPETFEPAVRFPILGRRTLDLKWSLEPIGARRRWREGVPILEPDQS